MKTQLILAALATFIVVGFTSLHGEKEAKKLATTDKYKVIRVDGRIVFQRTKTDMKKGDVFLSGTQLSFTSMEARAAVISGIKGRFVLSASEKGQTKILPAANNISSRSGALINLIDLKNHFTGNYLVINDLSLEIGPAAYPLSEKYFFYLAYEYEGETIRKKLPYADGNKILINKEELFKIDGEPIEAMNTAMSLYYMGNDETGTLINTFNPVFPDLNELKDEVQIIIDEFSNKSNEVKIQEITAYLSEFYGKPQKENLAEWLELEFDLK